MINKTENNNFSVIIFLIKNAYYIIKLQRRKQNDKTKSSFMWFIKNNIKLYKKYGNKYLAIKDKKVIGVFGNYAEGVRQTSLKEKLGTFIVQECGKDKSVYTDFIVSYYY